MSDSPRQGRYEAAGDHDATNHGAGSDAPRWAPIAAGIAALAVGLAVPAAIALLVGAACGVFQAEGWLTVNTAGLGIVLTPVAILCGCLAGRATARWVMSTGRMSQMTQWTWDIK